MGTGGAVDVAAEEMVDGNVPFAREFEPFYFILGFVLVFGFFGK